MSDSGQKARSSRDSISSESKKPLETKGDDGIQENSPELERNYSDAQLLLFLHEKKVAAEGPHAFIKEVHEDIDLHPISILTALGVDIKNKLGDRYHFFSKTRYPSRKATFKRDRMTKDGHHGWLQGGGKKTILDINKKAMTGFLRKFKFGRKAEQQMRSQVVIGSKSYMFGLEELVTAEDEEQEKKTASRKQNLESFLCVYRLLPITQSNITNRDPGTYNGPDGQISSPRQAFPSASDLESAPTLSSGLNITDFELAGALLFDLDIPDFNAALTLPPDFDIQNLESAPALPFDFDEI